MGPETLGREATGCEDGFLVVEVTDPLVCVGTDAIFCVDPGRVLHL